MTQGKVGWLYSVGVGCILGLAACSGSKELVVLLPDDNGRVGAVAVAGKARTVVLDTPLAAAQTDARGHVQSGTVKQAEVEQTFATALAAQPPAAMQFVLYFVFESTELIPESQATLATLVAEIAQRVAVEVQITGHTDRRGTEAYNDQLSLERAGLVRDMLQKRGLQAHFVRVVGRGEREPLVMTPDEQPEPRNRRVEIVVR